MELINAWGHAVSTYRNRGANARRLWVQARARGVDGACYRFSYDKKAKQVKPVKI